MTFENNCQTCQLMLDELPQGCLICDQSGKIYSTNNKIWEILNSGNKDRPKLSIKNISQDLADIISNKWGDISPLIKGQNWQEVSFKAFNSQILTLDVNLKKVGFNNSDIYMVTLWNNSVKKRAEQRDSSSKKITALGTLSGGIAHEYNNILMVVGGYIQSTMRALDSNDPEKIKGVMAKLEKAYAATERATILSKQLLIFSGKHAREHKVTNLSKSLLDLELIIQEKLPDNISLKYEMADEIAKANIDTKQFNESIIHLVRNAITAMSHGGELGIKEESVTVEEGTMLNIALNIPAGDYVCVEIKDTGVGIESSLMENIFDPFFTTKTSSSAGLGLAVVYGFMKASEGYLNINSMLDEGTTIQLFFDKKAENIAQIDKDDLSIPQGAGETILVVDDEEEVLNIVSDNLESLGYNVLTASDGFEGLEVEQENAGKIDLILTDVIMPGFTGPEMMRAILKDNPDFCHLFMSGFAPQKDNNKTTLPEGSTLLAKPVEYKTLAQEIRSALDNGFKNKQPLLERSVK